MTRRRSCGFTCIWTGVVTIQGGGMMVRSTQRRRRRRKRESDCWYCFYIFGVDFSLKVNPLVFFSGKFYWRYAYYFIRSKSRKFVKIWLIKIDVNEEEKVRPLTGLQAETKVIPIHKNVQKLHAKRVPDRRDTNKKNGPDAILPIALSQVPAGWNDAGSLQEDAH